MRRARKVGLWLGCGIAALLLAVASRKSTAQLPVVQLSENAELRVLSMSVGTRALNSADPIWKRLAATFGPSAFRKRLGIQAGELTSLAIELGEWRKELRGFVQPSLRNPMVEFPDGQTVPGRSLRGTNIARFEFPVFPRTEPTIVLLFEHATGPARLTITNPAKARLARWVPSALPVTNRIGQTAVILASRSHDSLAPLQLRAESLTGDSAHWMEWTGELRDGSGNWTHLAMRGPHVRMPGVPLAGDCWKLVARGKEYITAGMVPWPASAAVIDLSPARRALELGLERATLVGPGEYRLAADGSMARAELQGTRGETGIDFEPEGWPLRVRSAMPGILLLHRSPGISARLRERREPRRDGAVFASRVTFVTTNAADGIAATFYPLAVHTDQTELEAEIVFEHGPAEFFVRAMRE